MALVQCKEVAQRSVVTPRHAHGAARVPRGPTISSAPRDPAIAALHDMLAPRHPTPDRTQGRGICVSSTSEVESAAIAGGLAQPRMTRRLFL
jgi:hypothetical protein